MTLLRTLRSAALASTLLAVNLVALVLFLNPGASLRRDAGGLFLAFFLPAVLVGTAGLFVVTLLGALVRFWPRARAPWPAMPWITTLACVATGASAALFWVNLWNYRHSIPLEMLRALAASSVALSVAALVLFGVGLDVVLFPRHRRGASRALLVGAGATALVLPLAARPSPAVQPRPVPLSIETAQPTRRLVLIGMDGLGPAQVQDGVARGALPSFAQLLRRGAHGPLATLRPTLGPPIWTTIFTGRLPRDHGVKSFVSYRLRGSPTTFEALPRGALVAVLEKVGLVTSQPVTSAMRRRRALWDALNAFGIQTGVVRFWGTQPAEHVQGFMLSNAFDALRDDQQRVGSTLYPPELLREVQARAVPPADVDSALVSEFVDLTHDHDNLGVPWRRELVDRALAPDLTYQRAGAVLRAAYDPPFFANYFLGLDVVGHSFTRFAEPDRFGDVTPEDARRYGQVRDRYAALLGSWVGEAARDLRPGEVLLVVSGYGMQPLPLWRRVMESLFGNPLLSGTHLGAPDGFILAVGDGIKPGVVLRDASVLDLAPTMLYLMGLPVARDMEGRVLTEMLEASFARSHPVTYIPSYESLAVAPAPAGPDLPPLPDEP
jgi:predicted AlkP superfamily phosphohydrolase/phosphomutase